MKKLRHRFHYKNDENVAVPEIIPDDEATIDEDDTSDQEILLENVAVPEYHPACCRKSRESGNH